MKQNKNFFEQRVHSTIVLARPEEIVVFDAYLRSLFRHLQLKRNFQINIRQIHQTNNALKRILIPTCKFINDQLFSTI